MAFVNEYVSEEDIEKYRLKEIWLENNPLDKKYGGPPPTYRFKWTFDRERETFLLCVKGVGPGDTYHSEWVLSWKGRPVSMYLIKPGEGSKTFSEQPYRIVWDLKHLFLKCDEQERQEFLRVLKEALTVYGYAGARKQIPNTIVSFKF